jgi:phospholipid transport system substrate-binding protein
MWQNVRNRRFPRETALLLLAVLSSAASAAALGPLETLRQRDRQIRELLGEREQALSGDKDARLRVLVGGILDYEAHARESFGRYWQQLGGQDRKEALRLLTVLLTRSSMDKVQQYRSDKIQYVSESIDAADPAAATVTTRVTRDREKWEIGYRMRLSEGHWKIVDVVVEGASSVENNRAAFYKEIRASGLQGLLEKLRRKAEGNHP